MTPERREELIQRHDSLIATCDELGVMEEIGLLEMVLVADPDAPHYCFDTEDCIVCSFEPSKKGSK